MNLHWDQIKGDWSQLGPRLKYKWKKLTDADLKAIAGEREGLEGLLQDRYGYAKDQATKELDNFAKQLSS